MHKGNNCSLQPTINKYGWPSKIESYLEVNACEEIGDNKIWYENAAKV